MRKYGLAALFFAVFVPPAWTQPPHAGVYAIWYGGHPEVLKLPYIKGGQVAMQWGETQQTPAPPHAGVYAIWYGGHPEVLKLPYIKGGQVAMQWGELQQSFAPLDQALAESAASGLKAVTVQANGSNKHANL